MVESTMTMGVAVSRVLRRRGIVVGNLPLRNPGQSPVNLVFVKERVAGFVAIDHDLQVLNRALRNT